MQTASSIFLGLAVLTCMAGAQYLYKGPLDPSVCSPAITWLAHSSYPGDCHKFIVCTDGQPLEFSCPDGTVYSEGTNRCVEKYSRYDKCTGRPKSSDMCPPGSTGLVPHPDFCQRYYNCSDTSSRRYSFLTTFEDECKYPDLFDYVSKTCKNFEEATCLPGTEIGVEPCDYLKKRCYVAHCQPCYYSSPSCLGRSDGYHVHPLKMWSPSYVKCYKNRSIEFNFCDSMPANTNHFMIFSPHTNTCVPKWDIPRKFGGLQPDCSAKPQGRLYVTEESDRVYYSCPFSKVSVCDDGQVFSGERQTCVEA
ncbi:uncharacterized protein LOC101862413 [Aplysia californica]|uniref:Uncharacterized protein LOC101862413 n=1 Tax=Aplysia californica TaxID=6500 RepID=A0ABM0JP96_APLCA|nr:uncharacterized protein LOC101862413 [Aplysia californica]